MGFAGRLGVGGMGGRVSGYVGQVWVESGVFEDCTEPGRGHSGPLPRSEPLPRSRCSGRRGRSHAVSGHLAMPLCRSL